MIPASILIVLNQIKAQPNKTKWLKELSFQARQSNNQLYWLPLYKFIQDIHLISKKYYQDSFDPFAKWIIDSNLEHKQ